MRGLGGGHHHEDKVLGCRSCMLWCSGCEPPQVRQHSSSCASHTGQGGGLTTFTQCAKGTSSLKIHYGQASGCSCTWSFNSHSPAILSSPCVIQPIFTLGSFFPGSIKCPITSTNSIIYLKKNTTQGTYAYVAQSDRL